MIWTLSQYSQERRFYSMWERRELAGIEAESCASFSVSSLSLYLLYRWESWSLQTSRKLPKVTLLFNNIAATQIKVFLISKVCALSTILPPLSYSSSSHSTNSLVSLSSSLSLTSEIFQFPEACFFHLSALFWTHIQLRYPVMI